MNINQYMMLQLELLKEIKVNDQVIPAVKFELSLPHGCPWQDAFDACDDFKITLQNMKARQDEAIQAKKDEEAAAASAAQAEAQPVVEQN
jgi:hypothetical protein